MMHLHTMKSASKSRPAPRRVDLLAESFRAGQELYKAGLLTVVNARRAALGKPGAEWPCVGVTPHEEVWSEGAARLIRYDAPASKIEGAPILLVCSLINRPYVLDLIEGRSVVERLREAGRQVFLLDWGTPTDEDSERSIAEYALELLPRAAEIAMGLARAPKLHVVGYCMGGTLALMAIAAKRLEAASLVALATPVALHDEGLLSMWCRAPGFDPKEIAKLYGNAPPHLLQPAFKMLDPVGLATKLLHLEEKVADDDFVKFFLAMETWLEDSVAFPGRAFCDWVQLYREDALCKGTLKLAGKRVDLSAIDCPILNLVAEQDYITPPASSLALEALTPRAAHTLMKSPGGHIGLATSSSAQRKLWPAVAAWLSKNDPVVAKPVVTQPHKKKRTR
jgi:polyhydroxyalkanoate synthase